MPREIEIGGELTSQRLRYRLTRSMIIRGCHLKGKGFLFIGNLSIKVKRKRPPALTLSIGYVQNNTWCGSQSPWETYWLRGKISQSLVSGIALTAIEGGNLEISSI
ncbi:MAG: hypothetical protein QNJ50_09370 [Mastigocoleus sp. MO_188.B34]|nr:hypothetical protein [Mastigocoleus sp. MO_188.B34]